MIEVVLSREAERFFASADVPVARKLAKSFTRLASEPRTGNNIKRLTSADAARHLISKRTAGHHGYASIAIVVLF